MWDLWIGDERFVSGVVQNDRVVFFGVLNPFGQGLARRHHTRWIVGKTEIDQIDRVLREGNFEVILLFDR